jgi:antitoxin component YwqK of YwqJK toxin-antitoxin module
MTICNKTIPFILIVISGCSSINTINYNKIKAEPIDNIISRYIYKKEPMNGIYKIKYPDSNNFVIENYSDGYNNGKGQLFEDCELTKEENYLNGLLDGYFILYANGIKKTQYDCKNGLPNGEKIIFKNNGQDTLCSLT